MIYIYIYLIYKHKKCLKYIHACVCIYVHLVNLHSTHTYITLTKTFILDVINCDLTTHFTL